MHGRYRLQFQKQATVPIYQTVFCSVLKGLYWVIYFISPCKTGGAVFLENLPTCALNLLSGYRHSQIHSCADWALPPLGSYCVLAVIIIISPSSFPSVRLTWPRSPTDCDYPSHRSSVLSLDQFNQVFLWFEVGILYGVKMLNQSAVMIFTGICGALVVMAIAYYVYW